LFIPTGDINFAVVVLRVLAVRRGLLARSQRGIHSSAF